MERGINLSQYQEMKPKKVAIHEKVHGNGHNHEALGKTLVKNAPKPPVHAPTSQTDKRMPPVRLSTYENKNGESIERLAPYLDALSSFTGQAFIEAYRQGRVTGDMKEKWEKRFDREIYRGIRREYDLPSTQSDEDTGKFYKKVSRVAADTPKMVQETLFPESEDLLSLMNEVDMDSSKPHILAEYAAEKELVPRLEKELEVQFITMIPAGKVVAKTEKSHAADYRAEMQQVLGKKFFKGPLGHVERTQIYTQHNNDTNEVVWVQDVDEPENQKKDNVHWRVKMQDMRPVAGMEDALAETNKHDKALPVAVAKAIKKALERRADGKDDIIDPDYIDDKGVTDVEDYTGMKLVVKSPHNSEDKKVGIVRDKLVALVEAHFGDRLYDNVLKDKNGREHLGQSPKVRYKRNLFYFKGEDVPVEVIVEPERYYRNTQEDIGVFNPKEGEYDGLDHEFYARQRLIAVQPIVLPIAGDRKEQALQKLHEAAEEKKKKGHVVPPEHIVFHK
jgi:hypothetical protein